jgi:hypothetical protein
MYVYHAQTGLIYARIEELKLVEFGKSLKSLRQLRSFWLRCVYLHRELRCGAVELLGYVAAVTCIDEASRRWIRGSAGAETKCQRYCAELGS